MTNFNANSNIDPHEWATWLQEIQQNPEHHKKIVKEKNQFKFINNSFYNSLTKRTLSSKEILEISKNILKRDDTTLVDKQKIISGNNYIINKRDFKFSNLFFLLKIFAKIIHVDSSIKREKIELETLKSALNTEIENNTHLFIQQSIDEFKKCKLKENLDSPEKRMKLNENLFQFGKYLHEMKKSLASINLTTTEIKKYENQLFEINPNLPRTKTLVKVFGENSLKPSLKETVSALCPLDQFDQEGLKRDCNLFSCDPIEMQAIYVQRMAKAQRTDLSLSTVTAIENQWQEMIHNQQTETEEKQIGEHRVIFVPDPQNRAIYIKEKFLASGSFKAVFLLTSYLDIKKAKSRGELVILQSLEAVEDEIKIERQKAKEKQKDQVNSSIEEPEKKITNIIPEVNPNDPQEELCDSGGVIIHEDVQQNLLFESSGVVICKDAEEEEEEELCDSGGVIIHEDVEQNVLFDSSGAVIHEIIDKNALQEELSDSGGVIIHKDVEQNVLFDSSGAVIQKDASVSPKQVSDQPSSIQKKEDKAIDIELSPSALKAAEKEAEREAFEKEAALALEIGHLPGIWPTYKVTKINGETAMIQKASRYTIASEDTEESIVRNFYEIHELMKNGKLNKEDQIVFLGMIGDFLKGVQSLKQKGIIHRDLKSANILCSPDGHAGISDFGTACKNQIRQTTEMTEEDSESLIDDSEELIDNPDKGYLAGSNFNIAPEITHWTKDENAWRNIDTRADIWSCGIILWELLSGTEMYTHPAIRVTSPNAYENVGELLNEKKPVIQERYNDRFFPKPTDEDSILHLIWSCNRADPTQRIDIDALIKKYQLWAKAVEQKLNQGEYTSIHEAFDADLKKEENNPPLTYFG
jgi:serine/threonine protein kinase